MSDIVAESATAAHTNPFGAVVVDGHSMKLKIVRGRLEITDQVDGETRVRVFPRAGHGIRRIIVIAFSGLVTLDAMQWCSHVGVPVIVIRPDGQILSTTCYEQDGLSSKDGRMLRAQAAADGTETGQAICHYILTQKLTACASVLDDFMSHTDNGAAVAENHRRAVVDDLPNTAGHGEYEQLEGYLASDYFGCWTDVPVRFCTRDASNVPNGWHRFGVRRTLVSAKRRTNRGASNPMNALLNYGYSIAASEIRIACLAMGLEPAMGFLHRDARERDALVWDLMETVRPYVDRWVLTLVTSHIFQRADFEESHVGNCWLAPPLAHMAAATGPLWAQVVAPHVETVAAMVARSSPYKIPVTTPLTASNNRTARGRKDYPVVVPRMWSASMPARHAHCAGNVAA